MNTTPIQKKRILYANSWWHNDFLLKIVREAARRQWHLDFQVLRTGKLPKDWQGDGIITHLGIGISALESLMQSAQAPAVCFSNEAQHTKAACVSTDMEMAARMAAEHFIKSGFTSFAIYGHFENSLVTKTCHHAFDQRVQQAGCSSRLIARNEGRPKNLRYYSERLDWLSNRLSELPHPIAIFAMDDMLGSEIIEACYLGGLTIPHEVAVLGMLDMPVFRQFGSTELSSIAIDIERLTHAGLDVLADMMNGAPRPDKPILLPPLGIEDRNSTDTIASHHPAVRKTIVYMLEHFMEPISLKELSRAAGLSATALNNAFRKDQGKTPYHVLTDIRIEKAKALLVSTNEKVNTVSARCGMGSSVNLYRLFKKHVGIGPDEYRKSCS